MIACRAGSVSSYVLAAAFLIEAAALRAEDCNGNGVEDAVDIAPGAFDLLATRSLEAGGVFPSSLIAADLDNDLRTDLVSVDSSLLSVLLNRRDAGFLSPSHYPTPGHNVVAADVDGDGFLDLATARSTTLSILHNARDGTFLPATGYEVGPGAAFVTTADLNGDEKVDLVTANEGQFDGMGSYDGSSLSVLLNGGEGAFLPAATLASGVRPVLVIVVDLDADGFPDIAALNTHSSDVSVHWRPFFPSPLCRLGCASRFRVGEWPLHMVAADVNGDGRPDLVTASPGIGGGFRGLTVLLNLGERAFLQRDQALEVIPRALLAADLDLDGKLDLATTNGIGGLVVALINDGNGESFAPVAYPVEGRGERLAAVDLDRDGALDLATDDISILLNDGRGTFRAGVRYAFGGGPFIAADLDADAIPDLAAASWFSGDISVFRNRGDGTLATARTYAPEDPDFGVGNFPEEETIYADLDADGLIDRVTNGRWMGIQIVLESIGSYTIDPGAYFENLTAADLDADGDIDLATDAISIHRNVGDGTFEEPVVHRVAGTEAHVNGTIAALDLDGDLNLDLVTDHVLVLRNRADGSFETAESYPVGTVQVAGGQVLGADLDHDEDLDLIVAGGRCVGCRGFPFSQGMNAVAVLLNRGDGRLLDPAVYQAGDGPAALVVEDIDLDGELDLAVPNFYSANLSILLGNGDGTFRDALNFPAGQTAWRILAKDLDADGVVDLAVKTDGVAVFLNRTTPPASYDEDRDGIPDECDRTPFHRGDPNGSGTTDISDAITTFGYLFLAVPVALSCKESADSNSDAAVDISDGVYLLSWLFTGGPVPATPGPTETPCGFDPDPAGSAGDLGCGVYVPCQ